MRYVIVLAMILVGCGESGFCPGNAQERSVGSPDGGWSSWCTVYDQDGNEVMDGPFEKRDKNGSLVVSGHYCMGNLCGCLMTYNDYGVDVECRDIDGSACGVWSDRDSVTYYGPCKYVTCNCGR